MTEHWVTRRTGIVTTTPPTERRGGQPVWDESERPTIPEPPPDVELDPRGLAVGRHLVEVHDHYRAELTQLRDILDQVRKGALGVGAARSQVNEMALRSNNWALGSYCQSYCRALTEHHSMESGVVFGHLREGDPSLTAVVDRLDAEHDVIHGLLDAVDVELVALVQSPESFDGIQTAIDNLTDALLSHFAYEERELVVPLARYGFYPGQI